MPDFLPFPGLRYAASRLETLVAPPYDVIDEERRAALEGSDGRNAVRLILPRDDGARDRYAVAADTLEAWRRDGVLVTDPEPRLYRYRMEFRDESGRERHSTGAIGALGLPGTGGDVLPHERTSPKARSDRLALLRATRANLDPIWCLSLAPGLSGLLDDHGPALSTCVDGDGVRHELSPLGGRAAARVADMVAGAPVVIADGHHRFETACAYRDERADDNDAGATRIMALLVELVDDELSVRAIHRVLWRVGALDVRSALAESFDVRDAGPNLPDAVAALRARMEGGEGLGLADRVGLALLVPRHADATGVDAALFEDVVRPALPTATVGYRNDAAAVTALVEKGAADAAVLLRSVGVARIRQAALAGERFPQKTTFFHPKPRTGMVFRRLDTP